MATAKQNSVKIRLEFTDNEQGITVVEIDSQEPRIQFPNEAHWLWPKELRFMLAVVDLLKAHKESFQTHKGT